MRHTQTDIIKFAERLGLGVSRQSPGDGVTRYGFYPLGGSPGNEYSYSAYGYRAYGAREAWSFLMGFYFAAEREAAAEVAS